ncbi:MAG: ATP-binding cassette domain-containing protein [Acidimicrobiia bacterium]
MTTPVIETNGLSKDFGSILAVDNLSLSVPKGSVFGLLGPNGAGKTTIIGILLGLITPTSGKFSLFGEEMDGSIESALQRIGATMETPSFYPYLSGLDNLRYFQQVAGHNDAAELDSLLELVNLHSRRHSKFATYSLGMKHRLGIAYALLGDPELLLLDEPTNGLDPNGMAEVRRLLQDLGDGDRTVLLASHLLHEVEQVCDSVAILSKGRVIAQGLVSELIARKSTVRLATTDDESAATILNSLDWVGSVLAEDGGLLVEADPTRTSELSAALARSAIYVSELRALDTSLEEYFLEVTGEDGL